MLYFIAGLALIAAGVVMLAKPRLFFELTESWKQDRKSTRLNSSHMA